MSDVPGSALEHVGYLFYVIPPSKHSYERPEEVPDYVSFAMPVFVALIAIEALAGLFLCKGKVYRSKDMIASLTSGVARMVFNLFWNAQVEYAYNYIWDNYAIARAPSDSLLVFFIIFVINDFGYYILHRAAHATHLLWTAHQAHHAGEDYNFASALRQAALQSLILYPTTYMWMALFFPPGMLKLHQTVNMLTQFWLHTDLIGRLGPLEYILNTPSHHRMHHRPPGNCNYAGNLIIFDRMFGTFVPEDRRRNYYGLAEPLGTFETAFAPNFGHLKKIVERVPPHPRKWPFVPDFLSSACRRRANHDLTFQPSGLFQPIPPVEGGAWVVPDGSGERQKFDGKCAYPWLATSVLLFNFLGLYMPAFVLIATACAPPPGSLFPSIPVWGSGGVWICSLLGLLYVQGTVLDGKPRAYLVHTVTTIMISLAFAHADTCLQFAAANLYHIDNLRDFVAPFVGESVLSFLATPVFMHMLPHHAFAAMYWLVCTIAGAQIHVAINAEQPPQKEAPKQPKIVPTPHTQPPPPQAPVGQSGRVAAANPAPPPANATKSGRAASVPRKRK